jgi:threonine aldolase
MTGSQKPIDLRSDFCAPPTEAMWEAMRSAHVGWAVAGDDENVEELEQRGAELLGKEAAVFVPTCTMANVAALLVLGGPGQAAVVEPSAHVVVNEADGISELAGLVPVPVEGDRGRLDPDEVEAAIERSGASVLCLENTHTRAGGTVTDAARTEALAAAARRHGARVHLDGARLANAAVALHTSLAALAAPADTVALSLNKGLCAPFGALLAGGRATIDAARLHVRRLGGGTIHKAGIAAAAGLVALGLVDRLAEDHERARDLASLAGVLSSPVLIGKPETNILLTRIPASFLPRLEAEGVLAFAPDGAYVRVVVHYGLGDDELDYAAYTLAEVANELAG